MWLEHLLTNVPGCLHVALDPDASLVGCAAVNAQRGQWFVDDVAVRHDDLWPSLAPGLVHYIQQRPALTCVAPDDGTRADALHAAGCELVSTYWIRDTTSGPGDRVPLDPAAAVLPRPPHTFGAPIDHTTAGALAFSSPSGSVIGSPSIAAPPIYDPGGTVTVVDLVHGPDLELVLETASAVAHARGDVLVCVVCGVGDAERASALSTAGFTRTVDVHRFSVGPPPPNRP